MKGTFTADLHCPECAVPFTATINWTEYPGTRDQPPESWVDLDTPAGCESCGTLFEEQAYEMLCREADKIEPPNDDAMLGPDPDYDVDPSLW